MEITNSAICQVVLTKILIVNLLEVGFGRF